MKIRKLIPFFVLCLPFFLFGEGKGQPVSIGTRSMSKEAASHLHSAESPLPNQQEREAGIETFAYILDRYPPVYYSNAHHWLNAITILNHEQYTLELEDGSIWKISRYDGNQALNWRTRDPLMITQNNRWFSKYPYRILNVATGNGVEADLFLGPLERGEYSRFIIGIDPLRREIQLNDATFWEISNLDAPIFKDWTLNDYIIIGTNTEAPLWGSGTDSLLINVNLANGVRARQF